jgi:hypothetical protein
MCPLNARPPLRSRATTTRCAVEAPHGRAGAGARPRAVFPEVTSGDYCNSRADYGAPPFTQADADTAYADLKHADHRRLLSRWGKALFRYAGVKRDAFARRTGSYRENFINVLTICFGASFEGPGSYWYDNSNAGTFAGAIIYCATKGRVRLSEAEAYALFTKKQPERAASSWIVDEKQLAAWGVSPTELKQLLAGEPRIEGGFPRGAPLLIPPPDDLPASADPGAVATAAAMPVPMAPPAPRAAQPTVLAAAPAAPAPAAVAAVIAAAAASAVPLQRQNTLTTLAIMMCQSDRFRDHMEYVAGAPLDRGFSEGARSFMNALAALPPPRELAPLDVPKRSGIVPGAA